MKNLVVSSGAGISAESGITTFRDAGGLWENYPVMDVASHTGFLRNPALIHKFYNERRAQLAEVQPNAAHTGLVELEKYFNVNVITQNVDDLHERAGSTNVIHLHGELTKVRSERNPRLISDIGYKDIHVGDLAEDGAQLRPHIVWFGEAVPEIENAANLCETCDYFIVVGTSMNVYPAAGLINYVPRSSRCWLVDPNAVPISRDITIIKEKAGTGVKKVVDELIAMSEKTIEN